MEGNSLIFNSEIIRDWSGFANPIAIACWVKKVSAVDKRKDK
jgi:hypothetical protein